MSTGLKGRIKHRLKAAKKSLRAKFVRAFFGFTPLQFRQLLETIGLKTGDIVVVHSSFNRFEGFQGTITDIIDVLQQVVGPSGTVMMPTLPFTGTAVDHARSGKVFDVARSPSTVGFITEMFRRSPDVKRSLHPTHPVAVWGTHADELIEGHHRAATPCGPGTPWRRLLEMKGKVLFLGTEIPCMTFFHAFDEQLEPLMPFSPFAPGEFVMQSKDVDGTIVDTRNRLFDSQLARRRNLPKLVPVLHARGAWHEGRVGKLNATLLAAEDIEAALLELASRGVFCYEPEKPSTP